MEDEPKYSKRSLEQLPYRNLQKLAKSMALPCNVKKVYLIELIRAKKFSSESEVRSIVQRVKTERQQLAEARRNFNKVHIENKDFDYKKPQSPPIMTTPKRTGALVHSSNVQAVFNCKNLAHAAKRTYLSPRMRIRSDRVLRSYNLRMLDKNASVFNLNNTICISQSENRVRSETLIEIGSQERCMHKGYMKKHKPAILGSSTREQNRQFHARTEVNPSAKKPTTVSGIYPLALKGPKKYRFLQSVDLRDRSGKITKINALVQKGSSYIENQEYLNIPEQAVNLQDIMNSIDMQSMAQHNTNNNNNSLQLKYSIVTVDKAIQCNLQASEINERWNKTVQQQTKFNESCTTQEHFESGRLPSINKAFPQFKDITEPLYVQVGEETVDKQHNSLECSMNYVNCPILECIYNIGHQYLKHAALLPIVGTAKTKCVYATPIVVTATASASSTSAFAAPYMAPGESIDENGLPYTQESNSPEADCASIPELVEDALEFISQDGDYVERLGLEGRTRCMLCAWAGPTCLLESHLNWEHSEQICRENGSEWNITFSLGSLVECQTWLSQVLEFDSALYILSAKYEDPDRFMAALSTLSSEPSERMGSITTYNKVTGEPHQWQGPIQPFPSEPCQFQANEGCLQLQLSALNLVPNSANLILLNRELVNESLNKVVVGQPELDNIHIKVFVKILD